MNGEKVLKTLKHIHSIYLKIALLCGLVTLGVVFNYIGQQNSMANFNAMFNQRQAMLDMIADDLDEDILLWGDYEDTKEQYAQSLVTDLQFIDARPHTIGVLYDGNLIELSDRVPEIGLPDDEQYLFDPMVRPMFKEGVKKEQTGTYETDSEYGLVRLYWRWIPTEDAEFLAVTGISMNAVAHSPGWYKTLYNAIVTLCVVVVLLDFLRWYRRQKECQGGGR
jgi:hypothetical protein